MVQGLFCILCSIALLLGAYHIKKLWEQVDIFKLKFNYTDEATTKQKQEIVLYKGQFDAFVKAYHLEREVFLEKVGELSDELEQIRTAFDIYGTDYEEDRKALGQEIALVKDRFAETTARFEKSLSGLNEVLDEIKDSAIERNNEEFRMFQGIANMMNYDPSEAAKAVRSDG